MLSLAIQKTLPGFQLDLVLQAPEEQIIVLFGASGAGKSLTLGAIAGLVLPDAGHIAIGERVLYDARRGFNLAPQARRVGMVRQDLTLFPHLSVADNIAYGLDQLSRIKRVERVRELLTLVRLDGLEQRRPAQLSGGQQQRVALARALAGRPALLLLDEPFSALDYPTRVELRNELRQLQRRFGTSMLFVTHDLGEANLLADVLVVVQNGQVIQAAPPHVVLSAPANTRVAQIVGIRNRLPGIVTAPGTVRAGDCELTAVTGSYPVGAHVWLCLRPERVMLVRRDRAPLSSIPNALAGELLAEESDGNHVLIQFRAQPRRLRPKEPFDLWIDTPVYVHERLQLAHERHWSVSLKPQAIHLVAE